MLYTGIPCIGSSNLPLSATATTHRGEHIAAVFFSGFLGRRHANPDGLLSLDDLVQSRPSARNPHCASCLRAA
jgi:hypothetical protein